MEATSGVDGGGVGQFGPRGFQAQEGCKYPMGQRRICSSHVPTFNVHHLGLNRCNDFFSEFPVWVPCSILFGTRTVA